MLGEHQYLHAPYRIVVSAIGERASFYLRTVDARSLPVYWYWDYDEIFGAHVAHIEAQCGYCLWLDGFLEVFDEPRRHHILGAAGVEDAFFPEVRGNVQPQLPRAYRKASGAKYYCGASVFEVCHQYKAHSPSDNGCVRMLIERWPFKFGYLEVVLYIHTAFFLGVFGSLLCVCIVHFSLICIA